jgi:hypothetical protein
VAVGPDGKLYCGPIPSAGWTIGGDYIRVPTEMVQATDVPSLPAQYHMAIVYRAMMLYGVSEAAAEVYQDGQNSFDTLMREIERTQLPPMRLAWGTGLTMRQITFPKLEADFRAMAGGLDLVTPRIRLDPGRVFDACNYEPLTVGGYRRINGYERYDGRPSPSSADYWAISATITGTVSVAATLTGGTSGATGRVLGVFSGVIVLGRVVGTFANGEALKIGGVTVATATSTATRRGAATISLDADWRLLAANDLRADIGAVPGAGPVRGVFVQGGIVFAFRDNIGATQSILWKATSGGWTQVPLGFQLDVVARSGTATITIATPAVVTWTGHALVAGQPVQFSTTGALPTGIVAGTLYYVRNPTANTFELSTTVGGTSLATSGTQSGVHTATLIDPPSTGIVEGEVLTGATSGATGTVTRVAMRSGAWGASPVAKLVFTTLTGAFVNGEAIMIGGACQAQASGPSIAITRDIFGLPGGTVETIAANFTGSSGTKRTYGTDSLNGAFEFDGTVYVPIATGMVNAPTHVFEFRNYLFLAFPGGSIQFSGIGAPFAWTPVLGAGEIGTSAEVTGFAQLAATQAGAAMGIFTDGKHFTLYGTSAANFVMLPSNTDIGYAAHTIQNVANNVYGLTARGLQSVTTTLNYGDFEFAALSFYIQPLMNRKMGLATASVALKNKNQYRIFFSDGTGLVVGLTGEKLAGIMPLNYGKVVRCMTSVTLPSGQEVTYFASDDGYVYQDNVGTSFDGGTIEAWLRPAFNNLKSPRVRKQYRRAVFEVDCEGYTQVNIGYDLGYANGDAAQASARQLTELAGNGGFWDAADFNWDLFIWDAPVVGSADVPLDGTENNIGFLIYTNRAQDDPHTFQGVNLLYTPRRIVHSGS